VRVTGLEPVRHKHTPLKRACLPIPAHSRIKYGTLFEKIKQRWDTTGIAKTE